jgi:hypothetical protein
MLSSWGLLRAVEDADAEFTALDSHMGGLVPFEEVCNWAFALGARLGAEEWAANDGGDGASTRPFGWLEAVGQAKAPHAEQTAAVTADAGAAASSGSRRQQHSAPPPAPHNPRARGAAVATKHEEGEEEERSEVVAVEQQPPQQSPRAPRVHEELHALHREKLLQQERKRAARHRELEPQTFTADELYRSVGPRRAPPAPGGFGSSASRPDLWLGADAAAGYRSDSSIDLSRPAPTRTTALREAFSKHAVATAAAAAAKRSANVYRPGPNCTSTISMAEPTALPDFNPDNGVPGPGAYFDVYPAFGTSRNPLLTPRSSLSFHEAPRPKPRGISRLTNNLHKGMVMTGALADSPEFIRHRRRAHASGVANIRSGRGAPVWVHTAAREAKEAVGHFERSRRQSPATSPVTSPRQSPRRTRPPSVRVAQLSRWLELSCGILAGESQAYAERLVELGCDSVGDVGELRQSDLPREMKLLHRRRIAEAAGCSE